MLLNDYDKLILDSYMTVGTKDEILDYIGKICEDLNDPTKYISEVIYADPATIVYFVDGSKEIAVCSEDTFRKEIGLYVCLLKHFMSKSSFHKAIKHWVKNGDEKYRIINTPKFGKIKIKKSKFIYFPDGIIGYPDLKEFAIINDTNTEGVGGIQWLQSLTEPGFALPVMDPTIIMDSVDFRTDRAVIEKKIGSLNDCNLLILTTVTIPHNDIENISTNLQAPIIINTCTKKAVQVITDNDNVKYKFYDKIAKS